MEKIKTAIIKHYHTRGLVNCIGSVEKVVKELFTDLPDEWEFIPNGCLQTQHLYTGRYRNERTGEWTVSLI